MSKRLARTHSSTSKLERAASPVPSSIASDLYDFIEEFSSRSPLSLFLTMSASMTFALTIAVAAMVRLAYVSLGGPPVVNRVTMCCNMRDAESSVLCVNGGDTGR